MDGKELERLDIIFATAKLKKECTNQALCIRAYGKRRAALITRRVDEMRAANTLSDLRGLPQTRCHELTENLAGTLAVDLAYPYRLLFEVENDPIPRKSDGGLDWAHVTAVRILRVEDYHG